METNEKIIKKYLVLTRMALISYFMMWIIAIGGIILAMINDTIYFGEITIASNVELWLISFAVYSSVFIYLYIRTNIGMHGNKWKEIVQKRRVKQGKKSYYKPIIAFATFTRIRRETKNI